jgi:hypothetical protein
LQLLYLSIVQNYNVARSIQEEFFDKFYIPHELSNYGWVILGATPVVSATRMGGIIYINYYIFILKQNLIIYIYIITLIILPDRFGLNLGPFAMGEISGRTLIPQCLSR